MSDSSGNYIHFQSNKAVYYFQLELFGLGKYAIYGEGPYKIKKHKIIIQTIPIAWNKISKSTYDKAEDKDIPNMFSFTVYNGETGLPIPFAGIYFKTNKRIFAGAESDTLGEAKVSIEKIPADCYIKINAFGYNPVKIPVKNLSGGTWNIWLSKGELIIAENVKIGFTYHQERDTLLIDFPYDIERIRKLYKNSKICSPILKGR